MTVDVSSMPYPAKLVRAIHHLNQAEVPGESLSQWQGLIHDLVWDLAVTMEHQDVTGNAVTYRDGKCGVSVRIDQFVTGLRFVERKLTWFTKTYHGSEE